MSEAMNQTPEHKATDRQPDVALNGPAISKDTSDAPLSVAIPAQQSFVEEPTHYRRLKTRGERKFDWLTYGGIALVGNEVASFGITEATKLNNAGKPRIAYNAYQKFESWFADLSHSLKRFDKPGLMKYVSDYVVGDKASTFAGAHKPRLPYLLVATIGGMLMVPFVKYREEHKGEIVRNYDRKYYGSHADTDPAIVEAHKEMDNSPKQSWGSLWKGRVTTVIFAALADFVFGWPEALSTKLFKDNKTWQKYGSLERFSGVTAEKITNLATKAFSLSDSAKAGWRKGSDNAVWLLTLSSSLTFLFYISSKIFARRRDEKIERREEARATAPGQQRDEVSDIDPSTPSETMAQSAAPTSHISGAQRESTVATSPELLAQGV